MVRTKLMVVTQTKWKLMAETWELVKLPKGHKLLAVNGFFRMKYNAKGRVKCFALRVCLLHKDYHKSMALTTTKNFPLLLTYFSSIHILLAFGTEKRMLIYQMDAVSAFVNSKLKEKMYMQQL